MLSSLSNVISDYAFTSISYSPIHGLIIASDPPNASTYIYSAFSTVWNFGVTQD